MASNFIQPGSVMEFTAPSGGVTSGTPVLIGGFFVIPEITALATARFNGKVDGVWSLPRTASETWVEGDAAFWDVANAKVSVDPTVGLPIGSVVVAGLTADTTGIVKLNGVSLAGRMFPLRKRVAVATINAGAVTLLAAIAGVAWRLHDAAAIAIGGAVTSVTTVDVLGVVTTSRKLVAFGQAALTQSALVRAGSAGGVILADGASFTANDVNTAVTASITGSAITVATSVDFLLTVSLE